MSDELRNPSPVEEPSVLDYVKSLFKFGNRERIQIQSFFEEEKESRPDLSVSPQPGDIPQPSAFRLAPAVLPPPEPQPSAPEVAPQPVTSNPFPWRSLLAFLIDLL
jgi:hypothetical protein